MNKKVSLTLVALLVAALAYAQETPPDTSRKAIEELKYRQQPGLALAASKIFFSERRYSISGFGEANLVHYRGDKNTETGDIELYYTNLYRFATFFGYRLSSKVIWNSEFQVEYLHDGTREGQTEIVIEAFLDFLLADYFNARIGFLPLPIGYVNNNDEPVMFYSVNRAEVERLIVPTTWIEFGAMFYGTIAPDLSYALGISQGLNAASYVGGTWIRQGREIRLDVPTSIAFNPQLNYTGVAGLTLSASGYLGQSGQGETVGDPGQERAVRAPIRLGAGYAKCDWRNFRFVTVGSYGTLGQTDRIFELTQSGQQGAQVLGSEVYGALFELGCDILPYFRPQPAESQNGWLYRTGEFKLPLFVRYERLNTHHRVDPSLADQPRIENNLRIWTVGANFNPRENVVLKANYQFRKNFFENPLIPESDLVEFGVGFIF